MALVLESHSKAASPKRLRKAGICRVMKSKIYSEKNAFYFFRNRKAVRPSLLSLQAFFGVSTRRKGLPTLPQRPFCIAIRPPSPCNNGLIARRNGPLCFLDKVLPL